MQLIILIIITIIIKYAKGMIIDNIDFTVMKFEHLTFCTIKILLNKIYTDNKMHALYLKSKWFEQKSAKESNEEHV